MFVSFADLVVYDAIGFDPGSQLGQAVHFFLYDSLFIFSLLCLVIYVISLGTGYFPPERIKAVLQKQGTFGSLFSGALLGMITPFCSCSAVPLFIGLTGSGVRLGATFAFLIASPMINEIALALVMAEFGWRIAIIYVSAGLIVAIGSGFLIGFLKMEKHVDRSIYPVGTGSGYGGSERLFADISKDAVRSSISIVRRVAPFIVAAVFLGAIIHGYVPSELIESIAASSGLLAVPAAVAVGIPLYSGAGSAIPIASTLASKGISLGTVMAFVMSVTALSLPEMILLRRILKPKLLALFIALVAISIIGVGFLFNAIKF